MIAMTGSASLEADDGTTKGVRSDEGIGTLRLRLSSAHPRRRDAGSEAVHSVGCGNCVDPPGALGISCGLSISGTS